MDYGGAIDKHNRCLGNRAWCIKDICGIACVIATWLLILSAELIVGALILVPSYANSTIFSITNMFIFQAFAFLAFVSHLRAVLTDPGAVPLGNATNEMMEQMCTKCCSSKPARAHHCSICQRCIRKMDHHCPWINNCVGENNQKYFVLFNLYIALMSMQSLLLVRMQFAECLKNDWGSCSPISQPATIFLLAYLTYEGFVFGVLTIVVLAMQLNAIFNDQTFTEQLKNEEAHWIKNSGLKSMFRHFSLTWFSPFTKPSYRYKFSYSV
ncbi:palmitoyltransferase ZDHHC3-like [Drosophila busckii]|uniref:palmitoyltransferase ZDHHC3-like n=1 Tax=Drosophila busckii TaxID=30019 RepID=UPI00083EB681|nr:palmitoyltransferase ZDHHC3-like [Drosophila busckii]